MRTRGGTIVMTLSSTAVVGLAVAMYAFSSSTDPRAREYRASNSYDILRIAYSYRDGGGYNMRTSGVPEDIVCNGKTILPGDPNATHCCGITFAIVMKAAQERGLLKGVGADRVQQFQKDWYGKGPYDRKRGSALAMEILGIGREVALEQALPGDFVNFSKSTSGHSAVLLEWMRRNGRIIGIRYRSSQPSTDGIGDYAEYFRSSGIGGEDIKADSVVVSRLNPPG